MMGMVCPAYKQMAGTGNNLAFQLPVTAVLNSLVTLSVDAESLTLTSNESPGKVLSARVCAFANATCGSFQALTARGYLSATVANAGSVAADFTVTVRAPHACMQPCKILYSKCIYPSSTLLQHHG